MGTVVYIDGQNFMYKAAAILMAAELLRDKNDLIRLDIRGLLEQLLNEKLVIRYYGARVKLKSDQGPEILAKSRRFADTSRRLRNNLSSQNIEFIESGNFKLRDSDKCRTCGTQDFRFQEKGIDVRLAVDLIVDSLQNHISKQILISSDTDLLPAVQEIRKAKGDITYVSFQGVATRALSLTASKHMVISEAAVVAAYS